MSTEPEKTSLLAPLADAYEPSADAAERVFAKIQASLAEYAPATPTAAPAAVGAKQGKGALLFGLSCATIALVGAVVFQTTREAPSSVTTSAEGPPALATPVEARLERAREPSSEPESAPAIPSIAVDSLPSANTIPSKAPKKAAAMGSSAPVHADPPSDTLEREARLLADARRARQSGDGARALALLEEHASTFPKGWLANERVAERIVVLCSLGRRAEAEREAAVFLDGRPKSPLTRRVEMSCAGPAATRAGQ